MIPVENAPIKKYLSAASLLFKFCLSLPVKIYNGIDMISIPRNNISKVLNVATMQTPHKTKNIKAKYSDTWLPTFSISLPLSKKKMSVHPKATVIKVRLKLLLCNISFTSMAKNGMPDLNSHILAPNAKTSPAIAMYLGVLLFFIKAPPNIIITPQTDVNIIAFILFQTCLAQIDFIFYYLILSNRIFTASFVKSISGCGNTPITNIATTIKASINFSFIAISFIPDVNGLTSP